ncbi:MAG: ribosome-recycling factor [Chloroflexi bacterium]|nr:MAG: ribosome-recycling factor [Chloroflexota bacterium]
MIDEILMEAEIKMDKSLEHLQAELTHIRTGRANPALIEKVQVKAIRDSGQGLNPANDGQVVRVPIPPLTEERRKEYVRMVHAKTEEARVAVRNVRREEMHRIQQQEKAGEIPADQAKRATDQLQKITDAHTARIDAAGARKEAEVMEV